MFNKSHIGYQIIEPKKKGAKSADNKAEDPIEPTEIEELDDQQKFRNAVYEQSRDIKSIFVLQLVLLIIFSLWSGLGYDMRDCGINTYDSGLGICEDCLHGLGITCGECYNQDTCSTCKRGYMQYKNAANWTICVDCNLKHG